MRIEEVLNDNNIIIFGESHFHPNEVSNIRRKVVDFNPDVILHELYWEEKSFFKNELPNAKLLPLEDNKKVTGDLKNKFKIREHSMIKRLNKAIKKYNRVAVVVGDTHLRTIETEELGKPSPIQKWAKQNGAKIIRSPNGEIK